MGRKKISLASAKSKIMKKGETNTIKGQQSYLGDGKRNFSQPTSTSAIVASKYTFPKIN